VVIRFSNKEIKRAGKMIEEVMDVSDVSTEPVLSNCVAVVVGILELISLKTQTV
jgi:hypothetical protein